MISHNLVLNHCRKDESTSGWLPVGVIDSVY